MGALEWLRALTLGMAALIHLLPLSGVLGGERLQALYGLRVDEPNLALLLQHRVVLFGLLGLALLIAAFRPAWQAPAIAAGLVSTLSFLLLAWSLGGLNPALQRVVTADIVAIAALLLAAGTLLFRPA